MKIVIVLLLIFIGLSCSDLGHEDQTSTSNSWSYFHPGATTTTPSVPTTPEAPSNPPNTIVTSSTASNTGSYSTTHTTQNIASVPTNNGNTDVNVNPTNNGVWNYVRTSGTEGEWIFTPNSATAPTNSFSGNGQPYSTNSVQPNYQQSMPTHVNTNPTDTGVWNYVRTSATEGQWMFTPYSGNSNNGVIVTSTPNTPNYVVSPTSTETPVQTTTANNLKNNLVAEIANLDQKMIALQAKNNPQIKSEIVQGSITRHHPELHIVISSLYALKKNITAEEEHMKSIVDLALKKRQDALSIASIMGNTAAVNSLVSKCEYSLSVAQNDYAYATAHIKNEMNAIDAMLSYLSDHYKKDVAVNTGSVTSPPANNGGNNVVNSNPTNGWSFINGQWVYSGTPSSASNTINTIPTSTGYMKTTTPTSTVQNKDVPIVTDGPPDLGTKIDSKK
eukprot:gene701-8953_t